MSDRTPRISRRKLLQMSALTPLAALAAGGASAAEVAAGKDLPLGDVVEKAKKYKDDLDVEKFKKVATKLWGYFLAGAYPRQVSDVAAVLDAAYEKTGKGKHRRSGELIVDDLAKWDTGDHEPATEGCAYLCGVNARKRAGTEEIDVKIFRAAWDETEDYIKLAFARLGSIRKVQGKPPEEQKMLGFGC